MRHVIGLSLAALLALTAESAGAQEQRRATGVQWSVGGGVIASPRPYEGADMKVLPVPFVGFRAGPFFFETIRLGVRVVNKKHFEMDVLAAARFDGYEEDDARILVGMDERRASADGGVRMMGKWERVEVEMSAVTDLLSRHDGQEIGLGVGFPIKRGRWTVTPGIGAGWQSENLADYYYGVELAEAIPGRPAYEAGDTINPRVQVQVVRPFARRRWLFITRVEQEWLGSEIRDSPIVDASSTLGGYFAFIRNFK